MRIVFMATQSCRYVLVSAKIARLIPTPHTSRTRKFSFTTFSTCCGTPSNGAYFNLDAICLPIQPQTVDFQWLLRQVIAFPPLGLRHRAYRFRRESRVWEHPRNNFMQLPNPVSRPSVVFGGPALNADSCGKTST